MNYTELKRKAMNTAFSHLNPEQRQAVFTVNGPVLILAGAGSGKTTVLINRIANMIYFGNAYFDEGEREISAEEEQVLKDIAEGKNKSFEDLARIVAVNPITPWSILAITFTNKAANELKERLQRTLGEDANDVNAATFHSACSKILRREIEALGYSKKFTIYDTDDSVRVIKDVEKALNISDKNFPPKAVLSAIGRAKDKLITPPVFAVEAQGDYRTLEISKIYTEYQRRLKEANAVDFDDIIMLTVELFERNPDVLEHYQRLYKYVLVDEYQDTNHAQYKLISLLTKNHKNLCVVGDDDQSIYKFRGATIENILSFEKQFDACSVIKLEQNYRSTQNILSSANAVISHNDGRKSKELWTDMGDGEKVTHHATTDDRDEARFVADKILDFVATGGKYSDNAVLYRMNAQSRSVEQALLRSGIPYRIIGGHKFLDRAEVKDMLSYLCVINNEFDMLRFKRIVNVPKRGIGDATVAAVENIATGLGISPIEVCKNAGSYPSVSSKANALREFADIIEKIRDKAEVDLNELVPFILDVTGYKMMLVSQGDEGESRLENIGELHSYLSSYIQENEEPSLDGFLEEVSLYSALDEMDGEEDKVILMTVHSAKGLEFENVFLVGFEESIFPSFRSISEGDIDEERRLCYVAITRAKKRLFITTCDSRQQFGQYSRNPISRFLREIPKEYLEETGKNAFTKSEKALGGTKWGDFGGASSKPKYTYNAWGEKKASEKPKTEPKETFAVGDKVSHTVFGNGIVKKVTPMSNDAMLEIEFDSGITKKIMANFARLKKI